jgi:hypothetical protein
LGEETQWRTAILRKILNRLLRLVIQGHPQSCHGFLRAAVVGLLVHAPLRSLLVQLVLCGKACWPVKLVLAGLPALQCWEPGRHLELSADPEVVID